MQLVIGTSPFDLNSCDVRSETSVTAFTAGGRPCRYLHRLTVDGVLSADGQVALTILENNLRAALAIPYQDLILFTDSGLPSATKLINATSLSGVRIVAGPVFDNRRGGAEYSTLRSFTFVAEAEYLGRATDAAALLAFTETVSVTGTGGPVTRFRPAVNAPPVKQIVYPSSTIKATQAGSAVGHLFAPDPPLPLWPDDELLDQRSLTQTSPQALGLQLAGYAITWAYTFEAVGLLGASPNTPPLR
jgi:hypothetical protein